jgi:adenylate kinase family enzyme
MVRDRLSESDIESGFLLDGYPRTATQVDYLDGLLAQRGENLDVVLQLTADDDQLVPRLHAARSTGEDRISSQNPFSLKERMGDLIRNVCERISG